MKGRSLDTAEMVSGAASDCATPNRPRSSALRSTGAPTGAATTGVSSPSSVTTMRSIFSRTPRSMKRESWSME
jgi:hypothetical protein